MSSDEWQREHAAGGAVWQVGQLAKTRSEIHWESAQDHDPGDLTINHERECTEQ